MSKDGKFHVVTGVQRSGTSAMMNCLRECGLQIGGFKYPIRTRDDKGKLRDAGVPIPYNKEQLEHNPTGYWEYSSVVFDGLQSKHADYHGDIVKVLVRSLSLCDAQMVDKIILMMRCPRSVLSSRIRFSMIDENDILKIRLHCLTYINNITVAFMWMRNNSKQFKIIDYFKFINRPWHHMKDLTIFLGRGSAVYASDGIDVSLNRSIPLMIDCEELSEADNFYQDIVLKNFDIIYGYEKRLPEFRERLMKLYKEIFESNNPKGGSDERVDNDTNPDNLIVIPSKQCSGDEQSKQEDYGT